MDLTRLDPSWAWSEFQPSPDQPWDSGLASHLFRRAGLGAGGPELSAAVEIGMRGCVERLMPGASLVEAPDFSREMNQLADAMAASGSARSLSAWWLYRMRTTPDVLPEKMTLFWHNHFATSGQKVTDPRLMLDQNDLFRRHALGDFSSLVLAISRDPAMLIWLDSTSNRRIRPNENYARELMELFCLGPGNYTEDDIKQVARCFTGWEVRAGRFEFNAYQHDTGEKSFLGSAGKFRGEDAVRIVLEQPAAPRFIARKLVRYFVSEEPELPDTLIEPLAVQLRENGFNVGPVVRRILTSQIFYSVHAVGRKVKSPVELAVGLLRALEATTDMSALAGTLDHLGQAVFFPPNVKGWDGGRTWINSTTLLSRTNLVRDWMLGGRARFRVSLSEQSRRDGAADPAASVDRLLRLLVAVELPQATRQSLVVLLTSSEGDEDERLARTVVAIAALPEFQLN